MISFYPGPSKINDNVGLYMQEAIKSGILSQNHRSKKFVDLSAHTIKLLKEKLDIPSDYWIFYTSSATECWEIIAQSLIKKKSTHLYNGAFGEKWAEYTESLGRAAQQIKFDIQVTPDLNTIAIQKDSELICITHNETSCGAQLSNHFIKTLKDQHPEKLIAVDATSSMAGVYLDFSAADVWFASVQKCFGLPAGMALMVCSPQTIEKALEIGENCHYNSLSFMIDKMKDSQTTYTPNVLNIFLLNKVLQSAPNIIVTDKLIKDRAVHWYSFFKEVDLLIKNPECRSDTVITIQKEEPALSGLKSQVISNGFLLGNGYGQWSKNTFRIANFPAHTENEIAQLKQVLAGLL